MTDNVHHPEHYKNATGSIEPIVFCRRFPFCFGNYCKYVLRAPFKNGTEDLKKALVYLKWAKDDLSYQQNFWNQLIDSRELAHCFNNEILTHFFSFNLDSFYSDLRAHFDKEINYLDRMIVAFEALRTDAPAGGAE